MRKRRLYMFCLWVATLSVLLSTVVMHHHHSDDRICMVVEQCHEDGNYNDEHTQHHENEREGCRVHQMHHFFTNTKVVKSIQKHIFDGGHLWAVLIPDTYLLFPAYALLEVRWQHVACQLPGLDLPQLSRRGPPLENLM